MHKVSFKDFMEQTETISQINYVYKIIIQNSLFPELYHKIVPTFTVFFSTTELSVVSYCETQ